LIADLSDIDLTKLSISLKAIARSSTSFERS